MANKVRRKLRSVTDPTRRKSRAVNKLTSAQRLKHRVKSRVRRKNRHVNDVVFDNTRSKILYKRRNGSKTRRVKAGIGDKTGKTHKLSYPEAKPKEKKKKPKTRLGPILAVFAAGILGAIGLGTAAGLLVNLLVRLFTKKSGGRVHVDVDFDGIRDALGKKANQTGSTGSAWKKACDDFEETLKNWQKRQEEYRKAYEDAFRNRGSNSSYKAYQPPDNKPVETWTLDEVKAYWSANRKDLNNNPELKRKIRKRWQQLHPDKDQGKKAAEESAKKEYQEAVKAGQSLILASR